jgi:hypothetical protein
VNFASCRSALIVDSAASQASMELGPRNRAGSRFINLYTPAMRGPAAEPVGA